jgi:4-hydroxy-tetrahydrodipicolinate synthase
MAGGIQGAKTIDNSKWRFFLKVKLSDRLGQILIPLVTPFTPNGDVNYDLAGRLAASLVERKFCDSIIVTGTTGEFNTLTFDERVEMFKTIKAAVKGRVPLIAHSGCASTRESIKLTRVAEELGFDCALVVAPYYCRPTQEGIYQHFRTIAESVEHIPIMLYNIPIFTSVNIDSDTVARLAQVRNIRGIKDEAGMNPLQTTDYILATPDDFVVYDGDDIMVLATFVQGAVGVVSGGSHLVGDRMRSMISKFLGGDVVGAREIHQQLHPLWRAFCPNGRVNPMPLVRAALELVGWPVGPARLPLDAATDDERAAMQKVLRKLNLI